MNITLKSLFFSAFFLALEPILLYIQARIASPAFSSWYIFQPCDIAALRLACEPDLALGGAQEAPGGEPCRTSPPHKQDQWHNHCHWAL
jgi:hypothetical protein